MRDKLIEILELRFECTDVSQMIEFMTEAGILRDKHIKQYLIKYEYHSRLKSRTMDESCTDIKYDLAAEFDTSFSNVKNIVYNCKYVSV